MDWPAFIGDPAPALSMVDLAPGLPCPATPGKE